METKEIVKNATTNIKVVKESSTSILITLNKFGGVSVLFRGEHITKRFLLRVVNALKAEYKQNIRNYRKKLIEDKKKEINHD